MEMSAKSAASSSTVEPALKFGPPWLRALSHGNSTAASPPVSPDTPVPKYKLAQYRYGREEMLALFSKDIKVPECLTEFDFLIAEKCQTPLALLPVTDEEQRIWSRSVNSDVAVRGSNKGPSGLGNGMSRGGRGGSVDRGRGRGRGGYHPRGFSFEDGEDGSLGGYSRLRPIERSQSASEKDQRWEERDRRFERPFAGRTGGILDDTSNVMKQDGPRIPSENWRRSEKDDENSSWRSTNSSRGSDRFGNHGSWRNHNDRDRSKSDVDGIKDKAQHKDTILNGPGKNLSNHPRQRSSSGHFWDDEVAVDNLPEWSVEEDTTADVGTFDSSGAFLETKDSPQHNNSKEDIFVSDEEIEESKPPKMEKPQPKSVSKQKEKATKTTPKKSTTKPPTVQSKSPPSVMQKQAGETAVLKTSCETKLIDKPPCDVIPEEVRVPQTRTLVSKPFVSTPTVPPVRTLSSLLGVQKNTTNIIPPTSLNDVPSFIEEDTFAHHKTATENMMAQWTQEDEQRVVSETVDKSIVLPIHHSDAYKWFYRDPQGEIQGPFPSSVMCEWLNGGFFTKELKIKRGCDERFMQLGELTQLWNRIPFQPGNEPPPLRATPIATELPTPFTQSASLSNHTTLPVQYPQPDAAALQQQLIQQFIYRQVQAQQAANQLKQLDNFVNLPLQQQQALVLQDLHSKLLPEQQIPRSGTNTVAETSIIDQPSNPSFPLLGLNVPTAMLKNNISLWSTLSQNPGNWTSGGRPAPKATSGGIWDTDAAIPAPIEVSELEKRMAAEEEEKRRIALEALKRLEEEKRKEEQRKEEELKRKLEEERILREIQKQQEEEKKRLEEIQRLKEEEQRRLEEMRKEEERRREELRLQEERRKEEQRLLEEQRIHAELEEQQRREKKAREELRQKEETLRKQQEEKKRQEELQRKLLWEQEEERQREIEKQKEAHRLKEQEELEMKMRREVEEKERELQMKRENENISRLIEQKGPVWGLQTAEKSAESLMDIQKLQEQKEREEREKLKFHQQLMLQQQALKQVQSNKNGLSWAKRANETNSSVKSLAEIQMEEAQQMAHQQKVQKTAATTVQATAASGVWGNSSQVNRVSAAPTWTANTNCFWDDALKSSPAQNPAKTKECAFPALSNCIKPSTINSNKNKNLRAKKDEDAVLRLFDTHRKSNDEFTSWCTDALSHLPSSVDVPTFVAFLKDVESPYEVYDYVRSYLGEGKEAKEFGKQFLERRSKYRNQTKQSPAEENMWGPAPAITPAVNKAAAQIANDCDATICTKGKTKKKKNRMQKVDNSMLGFTVQPNSDRINIGEIDRVEGM